MAVLGTFFGEKTTLLCNWHSYHDLCFPTTRHQVRFLNIPCDCFFLPNLTQFLFFRGTELINEYQHLVGANLRWISVSSRRIEDSHLLNTTETGDKHRLAFRQKGDLVDLFQTNSS